MNSSEFALRPLDEARGSVTQGGMFEAGAEGHIPANLIGSIDALREGLPRMRRTFSRIGIG